MTPDGQKPETPKKGASPRQQEHSDQLGRMKAELFALMPARIPYSAWLFMAFSLIVLFSSLLVVYAAYENRLAYAELRKLEQQQRFYEEEWGQLMLERSTLSSPDRIEKLARESLQMKVASPKQIQVLE